MNKKVVYLQLSSPWTRWIVASSSWRTLWKMRRTIVTRKNCIRHQAGPSASPDPRPSSPERAGYKYSEQLPFRTLPLVLEFRMPKIERQETDQKKLPVNQAIEDWPLGGLQSVPSFGVHGKPKAHWHSRIREAWEVLSLICTLSFWRLSHQFFWGMINSVNEF